MRGFFKLLLAGGVVFGSSQPILAKAPPPCTCRAPGHIFELGDKTCLQTPSGPRIATCVMTLNVTSWDFADTPCGISQLGGRRLI